MCKDIKYFLTFAPVQFLGDSILQVKVDTIDNSKLDVALVAVGASYKIHAFLGDTPLFGGKEVHDVFNITEFTHNSNYRNSKITLSGIRADDRAFIEHLSKNYELSEPTKKVISELKSIDKVSELKAAEEDTGLSAFKAEIAKYTNNPGSWNDLGHHI